MNLFSYKQKNVSQQKGFALLLAVVIAGILISITFIMFSISLKQITLSTTGKNSQYALYAADTGIECALDAANRIDNVFENQSHDATGLTTVLTVPTPQSFKCNNHLINYSSVEGQVTVRGVDYPNGVTSTFEVDYPSGGSPAFTQCALVTVTRYVYKPVGDNADHIGTSIDSRGYNSCTNLDPQRLERGLEVFY